MRARSFDDTPSYGVHAIQVLDGRFDQPSATIRGMARGFPIEKLSDEFGQYRLVFKCSACGHERTVEPDMLALLFCRMDAATESRVAAPEIP